MLKIPLQAIKGTPKLFLEFGYLSLKRVNLTLELGVVVLKAVTLLRHGSDTKHALPQKERCQSIKDQKYSRTIQRSKSSETN